jgi:hypothetical protein
VSALVRITSNANLDEQLKFRDVLKSQIETLRKELGEQTPARIVPHPPIARPEKGLLDERVSRVKQQLTTSQRSRGLVQLPLPMDVSPAEISDDSSALPTVQTGKRPADPSGSRVTRKVYRIGSAVHSSTPHARGVLQAPPSAYPQVMPGSLSSTRPEPLPEDLNHPGWHVVPPPPNASTRHPLDNPNVHTEASMN